MTATLIRDQPNFAARFDDRRVLAVDPGKMTGIATALLDEGTFGPVLSDVWCWEVGYPEVWQTLDYLVSVSEFVVWETFTVTARTAKLTPAPWSLEVIGWLRGCCHKADVQPKTPQSPSQAKSLCTDDWLRERGLWVRGGAGHARDAVRHLGYYVAKTWGMSAIPLQSQ